MDKKILVIALLVGCCVACQQPTGTEKPASDSMELNNRGSIPVDTDTINKTDTASYDNMTNRPMTDTASH